MSAVKLLELVSVEDYLVGELVSETKHEYLGGCVYAMPGARNIHNEIASAWIGVLHVQLRGKPCRPYNSDTKVRVQLPTHTKFYYPDGMVVCEPNPADETFQDRPVVIAEVVSESTRRLDENEKRDVYLTISSLMTYLVIETDRPRIVVHRRTDNGFLVEAYEGTDAVVPLEAIEAELSLAELYERVGFEEPQHESQSSLPPSEPGA